MHFHSNVKFLGFRGPLCQLENMVCNSSLCWLNTINSFFNYRNLTKQLLNDSWWTGWKQLDLIMLICNALLLNEYIDLHFNMLSKKNIKVGWLEVSFVLMKVCWFLLEFSLDPFLWNHILRKNIIILNVYFCKTNIV